MKTFEELIVGDIFTSVCKKCGKNNIKFLRIKEIVPVTDLYYKGCEKETPGTILGYYYKLEELDGSKYITCPLVCKPNFKKFTTKHNKVETYYSDPEVAYKNLQSDLLEQLVKIDNNYLELFRIM